MITKEKLIEVANTVASECGDANFALLVDLSKEEAIEGDAFLHAKMTDTFAVQIILQVFQSLCGVHKLMAVMQILRLLKEDVSDSPLPDADSFLNRITEVGNA